MKKFIKNNYLYIIVFILFSFLFFLSPLTGDDWGKGIGNVIYAFKTSYRLFLSYNGRFLGNALVILLKTYVPFKIIFSSLMMTGIVYFLTNIFKTSKKTNNFLLIILLLFLMSIEMFRESISWMSGFANYVPPIFFICLYLYITRDIFTDKKDIKFSKYELIGVSLCALFTNLFCEHTSIFSVTLSILFILYTYVTRKKVYNAQMFYLVFAVIGCILTFLCPAYYGDMPRLVGQETFSNLSFIGKIIYNIKNAQFLEYLFFNNTIIYMVISALLLIKSIKNKKIIQIILSSILVVLSFTTFPLIYIDALKILTSRKLQIIIIILFLSILLTMLILLFYKKDKKKFYTYVFLYACNIACALPLLEAFSFGGRCIFCSYMFLIMFSIILFEDTFNGKENLFIKILLILGALLPSLLYLYMFYDNYLIENMRKDIIKKSLEENKEVIMLPNYKFYFVVHQGGMIKYSQYLYNAFKVYNRIPDNVIIDFTDKDSINKKLNATHFYIDVNTYDGSGELTHPCVINAKKDNHSYKYIMTYTPWPNNNNKYEKPSISFSKDAINWEEPENLKNPVDCTSEEFSDGYCSDPYIFLNENTYELWFRYTSSDNNNSIYKTTSTDGISWTKSEKILSSKEEEYMSMSVSFDGKYNVWYTNSDGNIHYITSKDLNNWTKPSIISIEDSDIKVWHFEIKKAKDKYENVIYSSNENLYYTSSTDGISFDKLKLIDTNYIKKDKNNRVYKSSILREDDKTYLFVPHNKKTKRFSSWKLHLSIYDDINNIFEKNIEH